MAISAKNSQDFVPIKEIRNGIIVLKNGSLRSVLIASSINLSLKSYDEQVAIIGQFQSFLNSLDFPVQIVVQSRKLDIKPYLLMLENRESEISEPLLKIQTREYIEFIRSLTEEINIMTKTFFVVVPYSTPTLKAGTDILNNLLNKKTVNQNQKEADDLANFEEKRAQLDQRVGVIIGELSRIGIRSSQLKTDEVVELFYKTFNPGDISRGIKLE